MTNTFLEFDPRKAQREMEAAANRIHRDATARLETLTRKDNPAEYDEARIELHTAREALKNIRLFGPIHLLEDA